VLRHSPHVQLLAHTHTYNPWDKFQTVDSSKFP
jgi:hypothetical protein